MLRTALLLTCFASPAFANGYAIGDTFEDPLQIARNAVDAFAYDEEGRPGLMIEALRDDQRRMAITVTETGYADDSVEGQRYHYLLEPGSDGIWTLTETRREFRCWRGDNRDWQDGLCP
jgi:hypothetical protein